MSRRGSAGPDGAEAGRPRRRGGRGAAATARVDYREYKYRTEDEGPREAGHGNDLSCKEQRHGGHLSGPGEGLPVLATLPRRPFAPSVTTWRIRGTSGAILGDKMTFPSLLSCCDKKVCSRGGLAGARRSHPAAYQTCLRIELFTEGRIGAGVGSAASQALQLCC